LHTHGQHHVTRVLRLLMSTSGALLPHLPTTTIWARARNHATNHILYLKEEFLIQITFVTSQDYQTRQLNTKEGNLTEPICTCHNAQNSHWQHSPTRATTQEFFMFVRHPEPQLKRCHSEPQLKECHVFNPYPEP